MVVELTSLWLPILLSAVAVFILSSLAWTALPHHHGDMKKLPNEDAMMAAVRAQNAQPGIYFFPHMKDCNKAKTDEAAKAKFENGPHGMLHVWPASAFGKMGRNMVLSFLFYLVTGLFIAYLGTLALPGGSEFMKVFQVTGTAGLLAYCFATIPGAIWFGTPLRNVVTCLVDGVVYALATGAIFAWLWPGAV